MLKKKRIFLRSKNVLNLLKDKNYIMRNVHSWAPWPWKSISMLKRNVPSVQLEVIALTSSVIVTWSYCNNMATSFNHDTQVFTNR